MKQCVKECLLKKSKCKNRECRMWIDYKKDLNCAEIAIEKNNFGKMTFKEVSKRLGVSLVRIKQIETKALNKIRKNLHTLE